MKYEKLSDVLKACPMLERYPWTARYILLFGSEELMIIPWNCRNDDDAEKVYKKCVEKGVTWKEMYGVNKKTSQEGIQL